MNFFASNENATFIVAITW